MMDEGIVVYDGLAPRKGFMVRKLPTASFNEPTSENEHTEYIRVFVHRGSEVHTVEIALRDKKYHKGGVGIWFDDLSINHTR